MSVSINSMFSSLSGDYSANNTSASQGLSLGDYAAIRNGSYGKLMKAYYKNKDAEKSQSQTTDKDTKQNLTLTKSYADSLKKSAAALMDPDLWEKKSVTVKDEETGESKVTKDYDRDAITKAVKSFVDSYNSVLSKVSDSDNNSILRNGVSMVNTTDRTASKLLAKVGITIGEDNKLVVDEEKLKSAKISDLTTLFTGSGSYADQISTKASAIARATENGGGIYTKNAAYSEELNKLIAGDIDTTI